MDTKKLSLGEFKAVACRRTKNVLTSEITFRPEMKGEFKLPHKITIVAAYNEETDRSLIWLKDHGYFNLTSIFGIKAETVGTVIKVRGGDIATNLQKMLENNKKFIELLTKMFWEKDAEIVSDSQDKKAG